MVVSISDSILVCDLPPGGRDQNNFSTFSGSFEATGAGAGSVVSQSPSHHIISELAHRAGGDCRRRYACAATADNRVSRKYHTVSTYCTLWPLYHAQSPNAGCNRLVLFRFVRARYNRASSRRRFGSRSPSWAISMMRKASRSRVALT